MAVRNHHLELPDDFGPEYPEFAAVLNDRFRRIRVDGETQIVTAIAAAAGSITQKATFGIGIETPVLVAIDITNHYLVRAAGSPFRWSCNAKLAPAGVALELDILKTSNNGAVWTSLFGVSTKIVVPIASVDHVSSTVGFAGITLAVGDMLRIDCLAAGGAQDVETVLEWR